MHLIKSYIYIPNVFSFNETTICNINSHDAERTNMKYVCAQTVYIQSTNKENWSANLKQFLGLINDIIH